MNQPQEQLLNKILGYIRHSKDEAWLSGHIGGAIEHYRQELLAYKPQEQSWERIRKLIEGELWTGDVLPYDGITRLVEKWDGELSHIRREVEKDCMDRAMIVAKYYILDKPVGSPHQTILGETLYKHQLSTIKEDK